MPPIDWDTGQNWLNIKRQQIAISSQVTIGDIRLILHSLYDTHDTISYPMIPRDISQLITLHNQCYFI